MDDVRHVRARAAGRVSGRALRNNRYIRAGLSGARITLKSVGGTLHLLWLEITGLCFLVFAFVGGSATVRAYRLHQAGQTGFGRAVVGGVFTVLFTYFGVSSFARRWKRR